MKDIRHTPVSLIIIRLRDIINEVITFCRCAIPYRTFSLSAPPAAFRSKYIGDWVRVSTLKMTQTFRSSFPYFFKGGIHESWPRFFITT